MGVVGAALILFDFGDTAILPLAAEDGAEEASEAAVEAQESEEEQAEKGADYYPGDRST